MAVGMSARHLSFIETGRSRPSRELLLTIADSLEVPLRERNALLLAAGFAPHYTAGSLDTDELRAIRTALEHVLAGHEPYPALVIDRRGDVQLHNRAVPPLLVGVDPALLAPPINIYRLSLHPAGLAPRVRNLTAWATHLINRLTALAELTGDDRIVTLLTEIRSYDLPGNSPPSSPADELMLTLQLAHPAGNLQLHSTVTHFGGPHDVTLAELAMESFVPANDTTRTALHQLAANQEP